MKEWLVLDKKLCEILIFDRLEYDLERIDARRAAFNYITFENMDSLNLRYNYCVTSQKMDNLRYNYHVILRHKL